MSYTLTSKKTGLRIRKTHREWEMLLRLAYRSGWKPKRGDSIDHYASSSTVDADDAAALMEAIWRAQPDVPYSRADGLTAAERSKARTIDEMRARPGDAVDDPVDYFSGPRRRQLIDFANLMAAHGPFDVEVDEGYSPEF
jgi:hypothetical protein